MNGYHAYYRVDQRALFPPPAKNGRPLNSMLPPYSKLARLCFSISGGAMLAISIVEPKLGLFAWIAFVPLLVAINSVGVVAAYCYGLAFGFVAYLIAAAWVADFVFFLKGYSRIVSWGIALVYIGYAAQVFALASAAVSFLQPRIVAARFLLFPSLFVLAFAVFPNVFPVQIGASQIEFPLLLQGVSYLGVYGVDFLILLVNGAFASILLAQRNALQIAVVLVFSFAWCLYGIFALHEWDQRLAQAAQIKLGIVQPNNHAHITRQPAHSGYSRFYLPEMEMTERLVQGGADLVIWPESRYKAYADDAQVQRVYQHWVANSAVPLIFQDMVTLSKQGRQFHNASILLGADGAEQGRHYKHKLMPIGEQLSWVEQWPWLNRLAMRYLGGFYTEVRPGPGVSRWQLPLSGQLVELLPLICYESLFPQFVAKGLQDTSRARVIVNQSNDSWFGVTRQPYQHLYASALRAIETRSVLLHVINNGPSAVFTPTGRRLIETPLNTAGGYFVDVPLLEHQPPSFFSRYPMAFLLALAMLALALCMHALWLSVFRSDR